MSALSDFGALSLRSPTQDVFQNPNPNPYQSQMSQAQPTPLTLRSLNNQPAHGYHSYQPHYQPAQNHPPNAMADPLPRPDNTSTPSKHVNSAPRTPDPAAMQNGAFAGMGLENPIPSTPQHLGSGSMALVRMEESAPDHGLTRKFDRLFHMAERYSYSHMNFPSAAKDSQLPLTIKDRLMNAATRESAHQLGSTGSTRYFLMTKVILQWMSKHVFKQSLFTGFDLDADRRIAAYKDNIYQGMWKLSQKAFDSLLTSIDTPPFVKFQLLSEISKEIRQIRENPKFPRFLDTLVKNQGNKLWAIVHPLMHHTTAMDWEDLRTLMYEAYSVAGDAAARPYEWRFDFAQIGSNYNSSMINRDPYIRGHEEELARRALVVRLGFLPAVYLRDNADGVVRAGQVTRHQVLMKGQ